MIYWPEFALHVACATFLTGRQQKSTNRREAHSLWQPSCNLVGFFTPVSTKDYSQTRKPIQCCLIVCYPLRSIKLLLIGGCELNSDFRCERTRAIETREYFTWRNCLEEWNKLDQYWNRFSERIQLRSSHESCNTWVRARLEVEKHSLRIFSLTLSYSADFISFW